MFDTSRSLRVVAEDGGAYAAAVDRPGEGTPARTSSAPPTRWSRWRVPRWTTTTPTDHGILPHVTVTIPWAELLASAGVGEAPWTGPISAAEVRRLLDDSTITRLIVDRADGISVVGEAGDGQECLDLAREHRPDRGPGRPPDARDGRVRDAPRLRRLLPDVAIVVLTTLDEDEATREAALVGATAFLEERHIGDRLVPLLRRQASGVP